MSDDEADPELLELLRKRLGIGPKQSGITSQTNVLRDAEYIYSNAIDVAIDRTATVAAAESIWTEMQSRNYSRSAWAEHELHPEEKDEATLNFIFTMDLLNFSFWSELAEDRRWSVFYRGKRWTGYWSLVACLRRALDEGVRITDPSFWLKPTTPPRSPVAIPHDTPSHVVGGDGEAPPNTEDDARRATDIEGDVDLLDEDEPLPEREAQVTAESREPSAAALTLDTMQHVFRGDGDELMPMLAERLVVLREAGRVLHETFDGSVVKLLEEANHSAGKLVNLLAHYFDCFRDEAKFDRKKIRFLKRAQIFVADVWAAFDGRSWGQFEDIDSVTMFADYRIPQQLHALGCFSYSPSLTYTISKQKMIDPGSSWECQLRGCSIWVIELIRRHILTKHPDAHVNAILIDFFLYDLAKEREKAGEDSLPHHRTRSIWY